MHDVLLAVFSSYSTGLKGLREVLKSSTEYIKFTAISTVYGDMEDEHDHHMACVAKGQTDLDSNELVTAIKAEEAKSSYGLAIRLLAYESEVRMDPELVLPHPELTHSESILQGASEIWGNYQHPILERTLSEIRSKQVSDKTFEFILSGRDLLRELQRTGSDKQEVVKRSKA